MSLMGDSLSTPGYEPALTLLPRSWGRAAIEQREQFKVGGSLSRREDATLSGRIKLAMHAAGLKNQADLARKMKVHRQTVNKWFTGDSDDMTPALLFKLSDALNVSPRWLALGPPESPVKPQVLDPESSEVLQIKETLENASQDAKEQWLSQGRGLVRVVAPKSAANPFPSKVK